MSYEAMAWAMDHAPMLRTDKGKPDTSARHVLQVLAEHAHKDGTNAHPSVLRVQYRTGFDRTTVQRALRRLEKGGLIKPDGTNDGRPCWRLAMDLLRPQTDWNDLEREEEADRLAATERKRRSRASSVTHSKSVTVTDSKGVTVTDAESVTADVTDFKYVGHALNAALTTNQPSLQELKDSCSTPAAQSDDDAPSLFDSLESSPPATSSRQADDHLAEFEIFWKAYPKRKGKADALKAWKAALKTGADPAVITSAAEAYALEKRTSDPRFIKYPAGWLRDARYEDDPEPEQTGPTHSGYTDEEFHSGFAS